MLKSIKIENFTVFSNANIKFGKKINVIVGENGAGKSHLLKIAYSVLAVSWEEGRKPILSSPTKAFLQTRLAEKLVNVFRPEALGRLARRRQGRARCDVELKFFDKVFDTSFSLATNSRSEVSVETLPLEWCHVAPAFIPTRELLTIFPNFVSIYDGHYLEFEETWRDTCLLLGAPMRRGPTEVAIREMLEPLEAAMQGSIEFDSKNGRFYLRNAGGRMEMPLVAEGLRKLGMLARLIGTGVLLDKGCLFWDEPEANLNPRLIKTIARCIIDLSKHGIQIFIGTHSLFLLRELEIILEQVDLKKGDVRFFGLHQTDDGVDIGSGDSIDDIGEIASLDEELAQSDRFLELQ